MGRKIALLISAALAAGAVTGCGGQKYTAEDGSFSIVLPGEEWEADSAEYEGLNMYTFSLPATSDSALETEFEDQAVITYAALSEETINYETIPVTEEELTEQLGEGSDYEVLSFEGETDKNGVKSNFYSLKIPASGDSEEADEGYYMVFNTSAGETEGYFAGGMIFGSDEELLKAVEKSIKSISVNSK